MLQGAILAESRFQPQEVQERTLTRQQHLQAAEKMGREAGYLSAHHMRPGALDGAVLCAVIAAHHALLAPAMRRVQRQPDAPYVTRSRRPSRCAKSATVRAGSHAPSVCLAGRRRSPPVQPGPSSAFERGPAAAPARDGIRSGDLYRYVGPQGELARAGPDRVLKPEDRDAGRAKRRISPPPANNPWPLEDATLATYLAELHDQGRAPASASTAVAAACFRARLDGEPSPAGERTARVLGGYRRTGGDRGRGQARPFGAADLAAVLATCHRPRRRGRGVESDQVALDRGRLDAVIAGLLFMAGMRRSEVSALDWADVGYRHHSCSDTR